MNGHVGRLDGIESIYDLPHIVSEILLDDNQYLMAVVFRLVDYELI